ncbi:SfnB family sulfur acquisition oxidoreductase [Burkholderia sp. WAC0059]|uniref:SfnB family sulfur acquisition oxidoreductase n=1 Tax=Burkholderia sp. WAC0059 TaxID=2066022 RepID=UPI000C7F2925|nr:SfnB family sulfur acquisition oxidoreductase [Burkholderia sp. WAC0059]PLZ01803.1 SfnB family sulfur acquisition oxidoreductase [Burkholderia sp. WAC0059]
MSRPAPVGPARPDVPAYRIADDADALSVARSLAEAWAESAADRDRERRLPQEETAACAHRGLTAVTVPRAYGGAEVSLLTLVEVLRLVSAADPSIGEILRAHFDVIGNLRATGSAEQQRVFFERALAGQRFARTTPEHETRQPARDSCATLSRERDGWRLRGAQSHCTGALLSDWLLVEALGDDDAPARVLVPRDAPGLAIRHDEAGLGLRTTASGTLAFERVPVAADQILPPHPPSTNARASTQLMQAAIDAGIAEAALRDTIRFVNEHARPWIDSAKERAGDDPYVMAAVGNLSIRSAAANALLRRAARLLDEAGGEPVAEKTEQAEKSAAVLSIAVAEARVLAAQIALDASGKLFELSGTGATLDAFDFDRHWRNAQAHILRDPVRRQYALIGRAWLHDVEPDSSHLRMSPHA